MYKQDNDKLYRYLFQNRAVRGEWVRLNDTFTETLNTHHYPTAVQNLLGEMLRYHYRANSGRWSVKISGGKWQ